MRYNKSSHPIKPQKRVRLSISTFEGINTTLAEELVPFKYSPKSYNYKMSGGILQQGNGFKEYVIAEEVGTPKKICEYRKYDKEMGCRDDRIIVVNTNNEVWQHNLKTKAWSNFESIEVSGAICAVNYRYGGEDVLLFSSLEGGLYVIRGDTFEKVKNSPKITSMCTHYDRVYCSVGGEKNAVWFSDDFDPSNWNVSIDEGGYIEFNDDLGEVIKVISFVDRVFIFREYGINRMAAYSDQTNFAVSRLYISTGRIIADTVTVCGSAIIFQADNAVYQFDGLDARRIMTNLTGLFLDNEDSIGVFYNGSYYLACCMDLGSQEGNNSLIEYRLYDGDVSIMHGFCVKDLTYIVALENKFLAVVDDRLAELTNTGCLFDVALQKLWTTPQSSLGLTDTVKILKEVLVNTKYDAKLEIELDGIAQSYYLNGDTRYQTVKINQRFDTIKINIISECGMARISRIELIVDLR